MLLVKAQCTNCGATLDVDSTKEAALCPYCNTAYIVEKAINNYKINVTNNINADTVNIINKRDEFDIVAGKLNKYIGRSLNVTIPEDVKELADGAFKNTYVETVTIPDSVRSIGAEAFCDCIDLKTVVLPKNIDRISEKTFYNCKNLKEIQIQDGVKKIGKSAFCFCESLKTVKLPDSLIEIDEEAFAYISIDSIVIPNYVEVIREKAFSNCNSLKSVTLSRNLKILFTNVFSGDKSLEILDTNSASFKIVFYIKTLFSKKLVTSNFLSGLSNKFYAKYPNYI